MLRNPAPAGPGTFWYQPSPGQRCIYIPSTSGSCYTVTGGSGGAPGAPPIDPRAVAASVAARMALKAGELRVSPSPDAKGLTGADSWFWLDPPPGGSSLPVGLGDERVVVSARPAGIEWRFGDGESLAGGPGVAYRPGAPPGDAIRHRYEVRCLPGDQGRNPYVLASCGAEGYRVEANVAWDISFTATGPVTASGPLPGRSTLAELAYPVSEARGFLVEEER